MRDNRDDIGAALDDILAHKTFASSKKAAKFLSYIVTEYLDGRGDRLSETVIAQDLFGFGSEFDPAQNSVVRVTARRVRHLLDAYNAEEKGPRDLKITLPKGGYRPLIEYSEAADILASTEGKAPLPQRRRKIFTALAISAAALFAVIGVSHWGTGTAPETDVSADTQTDAAPVMAEYPIIGVTKFYNETGNDRYDFIELVLQRRLVEDLARFQIIQPVAFGENAAACLTDDACPYDSIITAKVYSVEPQFEMKISLTENKTGKRLFEKTIMRDIETPEYFESLYDIVSEVSGNFAGHNGAIIRQKLANIEAQIEKGARDIIQIDSLECIALTRKVFIDRTAESYAQAYNCLKARVETEPNNPTLLSMFGNLIFLGTHKGHKNIFDAKALDPDVVMDDGIAMMQRAAILGPNNAIVNFRLASYYNQLGDRANALKHAELAHLANPADQDIMYFLAVRLAGDGQWERAMSLSQAAKNKYKKTHPNENRVAFMFALSQGDKRAMQSAADKIALTPHFHKDIFSFLAAVANEDTQKINALRPKVIDIAKKKDRAIDVYRIPAAAGNEALVEKSRALLIKGGVYTQDDELLSAK